MSKKAKCMDCENLMFFATPLRVNVHNYEYAKQCLYIAKRSIVCGHHGDKVKPMDNEQYCRHLKKSTRIHSNEEDIKRLEDTIAEYEKQLVNEKGK